MSKQVLAWHETDRFGVGASNPGHKLQKLLRLLKSPELIDQLPDQVKLLLSAILNCVVEDEDANTVEKYNPTLEGKKLARVLSFLLQTDS